MNRRRFLTAQLGGFALFGVTKLFGKTAQAEEAGKPPRRGVSLAGPEFATEKADFTNENPGEFGRDYTYNSERTVAYFCEHNLGLLRLPVRWERIQPRLRQPLNEAELDRLKTAAGWARKHRGELIIDIHNYGRYALGVAQSGDRPRRLECIIDHQAGDLAVTRADFADLWRRLSEAFRDDAAVYAYGLMNEPHDMSGSDWQAISQAAVDAIRRQKDNKLILVAGDHWSNAFRFAEVNGRKAWIKDPAERIAYEAHCYFDHDHSGHYEQDYAAELSRDPRLETRGAERVKPFIRWCRANRAQGFLGEFGIPAHEPRWQPVLRHFLEELDRAGMEGCYWAAGEWWGSYPLSVQPHDNFQTPAPQLAVLKH
jgi:endoglucanase